MFINSQHMVFINLVISILLGICLIGFKAFFPKKKINLFFLLIVISLLPCISMLRSGTYESGVLSENIQISTSFYDNLTQGNIIPVWGAECYGGYGFPAHIYLYPLGFYLSAFFHFLGFSFLVSVKLVLAFAFVISGITMYLWMKNEFGKTAGFVSALFYVFAPYHLIETHFRATLGTTVAYALVPLVLFFIIQTLKKPRLISIFLGGVSFALLILAQIEVAFISFPIIIFYLYFRAIVDKKLMKGIFHSFALLLLGLLFSSYYVLPSLFLSKDNSLLANIQSGCFIPLKNLLYSPTMFGLLFQGHHGETHFIIGYAQLLMVGIGLPLVFFNKIKSTEKKFLIFFLSLLFIYVAMTQSLTAPIWNLPLVRDVYGAWRLLAPIALIASVIAAIIIHILQKSDSINKLTSRFLKMKQIQFSNVLIVGICLFVVFSTILNWGNRKTVPIDYGQIKRAWIYMPISEVAAKVLWTPWVDPHAKWVHMLPDAPMDVVSGKAEIFQIKRVIADHTYIIHAKTNVVVVENTMYFPGWIVKVNNKEYPFSFTSYPNGGLMTFHLKKGLYKVEALLTSTSIQNFANMISIFSFLSVGLLISSKKLILKKH